MGIPGRRSWTRAVAVVAVAGCAYGPNTSGLDGAAPGSTATGTAPSDGAGATMGATDSPVVAGPLQTPTITSYYPPIGAPGTTVRIYGTGFGLTQGAQYNVYFSNVAAEQTARVTDSSLTAVVPASAKNGPITMNTFLGNVNSRTATGPGTFRVIKQLFVTPLNPMLEGVPSVGYRVTALDASNVPLLIDNPAFLSWSVLSGYNNRLAQGLFTPPSGTNPGDKDQVGIALGALVARSNVRWTGSAYGEVEHAPFAPSAANVGAFQPFSQPDGATGSLAGCDHATLPMPQACSFDAFPLSSLSSAGGVLAYPIFCDAASKSALFSGPVSYTWAIFAYPDTTPGGIPDTTANRIARWEGTGTLPGAFYGTTGTYCDGPTATLSVAVPGRGIPVTFPMYPQTSTGFPVARGDLYVQFSGSDGAGHTVQFQSGVQNVPLNHP